MVLIPKVLRLQFCVDLLASEPIEHSGEQDYVPSRVLATIIISICVALSEPIKCFTHFILRWGLNRGNPNVQLSLSATMLQMLTWLSRLARIHGALLVAVLSALE